MESNLVRKETINKANRKLTGHITNFLMQFEKLEMTDDGQLIGWYYKKAYVIKINVAITTKMDEVDFIEAV